MRRYPSGLPVWSLLAAVLCISTSLQPDVLVAQQAPAAQQPQKPVDVVLLDGKIATLDAADRVVSALAVRDGRIAAVGSNDEMQRFVGPGTRVVRLGGKTVVPGFIETHCHAVGVARNELAQPYTELYSIADIQAWIRRRAREVPAGEWIQVPRNDITRLKERRHPTPSELDASCTTHPVVFISALKHVFNTAGWQRVELAPPSATIPDGTVLRDEAGRPLLVIGAESYLQKYLPAPKQFTDQETLAALANVHRIYNQVGITSIFERAAGTAEWALYQQLREQDKLTVRTTMTFRSQFRDGPAVEQFVNSLGLKPNSGDDWLKTGPLKIMVDGGIHWGTTYLSEPYGDRRIQFYRLLDAQYRGDLRFTVPQMAEIFTAGHRLGWQMSCHVTGDAGVDAVLDALAASDKVVPVADRRFSLIHAYFPRPESVARCRRLDVVVDTQSYLYYRDADTLADVYGPAWAERFIGLGDWVRGGVPVAINSDHMIGLDPNHAMNSFNPALALYIAVSRKTDSGAVHGSHQKLSREEALRAMTTSAAYLSFDEAQKGSLEPGKLADLALLDRDYFTCPEEDIARINVVLTMVGGRVVHERKQ